MSIKIVLSIILKKILPRALFVVLCHKKNSLAPPTPKRMKRSFYEDDNQVAPKKQKTTGQQQAAEEKDDEKAQLYHHLHQLTLHVQEQEQELALLKQNMQTMTQLVCSAVNGTKQKFSEIENYLYRASVAQSSSSAALDKKTEYLTF